MADEPAILSLVWSDGQAVATPSFWEAWRAAKGTASPITVGHLPKGKVYCQVRAHNKLGWGTWSATKHT